MPLEALGTDAVGRDLFFGRVERPADLTALELPSAHFVTLLVWHASGVPTDVVSGVVEHLCAGGASYLCAWGSDCERVHDVADETDAFPSELASPHDAVRLTTWHTDDSLDEVVDFLLRWAVPHAYYAPTTTASLVLCVGDDLLASATRLVLASAQGRIETMREFAQYLARMGELHDATIIDIVWNASSETLTVAVDDLYWNFESLPGYPGPTPGELVFEGVCALVLDVDTDGPVHIHGITVDLVLSRVEIHAWPRGLIKVTCARVTFPPCELRD